MWRDGISQQQVHYDICRTDVVKSLSLASFSSRETKNEVVLGIFLFTQVERPVKIDFHI